MRIETKKSIYNGSYVMTKYDGKYIDGYWNEQYLFANGYQMHMSDVFVNAGSVKGAVNQVLRRLGFASQDEEEINDNIEFGYYDCEECDYHDEDGNSYNYYVCIRY